MQVRRRNDVVVLGCQTSTRTSCIFRSLVTSCIFRSLVISLSLLLFCVSGCCCTCRIASSLPVRNHWSSRDFTHDVEYFYCGQLTASASTVSSLYPYICSVEELLQRFQPTDDFAYSNIFLHSPHCNVNIKLDFCENFDGENHYSRRRTK